MFDLDTDAIYATLLPKVCGSGRPPSRADAAEALHDAKATQRRVVFFVPLPMSLIGASASVVSGAGWTASPDSVDLFDAL